MYTMRCLPHTYVCKTLRSTARTTAKILTVALVMILLYEVYAVTVDGWPKYRRRPVSRKTQAYITAPNEQKREADRQVMSQVRVITYPDVSEKFYVDDLKAAAVDRKAKEIRQTNSPVGPVYRSDWLYSKSQTEHADHVTPVPAQISTPTTLVVGRSHATYRLTRVKTPETRTVMANNDQLLRHRLSSNPNPQELLHTVSMNPRRDTQRTHTSRGNTATIPPIPLMGDYKCRDKLCREFLSRFDEVCYKHCYERLLLHHEKEPDLVSLKPGNCHFMDGTNRAAVALVSFPGSGNTWVRGLLEQATGICTGAVYCDYGIRGTGFNGEGLRTGSVIAIKTHKTQPQWTDVNMPYNSNLKLAPSYGAAILLIRNPRDALVAEWNRDVSKKVTYDPGQNSSSIHVKYVGQEYFGYNLHWNSFVMWKIKRWQEYFIGWAIEGLRRPVLVVRYEDLETDRIGQMKRMLDFLRVPYSEEELLKRMEVDPDSFHRKHHADFEHFTPKQRDYVQQRIIETLGYLKKRNHGDTLGVAEYLDLDIRMH